ncbi:MAG: hypothetical protein ACRDNI_02285 [Gaiellaceae bacterium]
MSTSTRPSEPAAREVVAWRRRQLTDAGFDRRLAAALARDCRMDLHAVVELVERGCPPDLAARILAPLEEEGRPC